MEWVFLGNGVLEIWVCLIGWGWLDVINFFLCGVEECIICGDGLWYCGFCFKWVGILLLNGCLYILFVDMGFMCFCFMLNVGIMFFCFIMLVLGFFIFKCGWVDLVIKCCCVVLEYFFFYMCWVYLILLFVDSFCE